ncbi:MAG: SDR family oxidoreductase [Anaerolineae bacterium]|nr:SDR family oxidoreductase [Anaerolineae bacterium]NUQ04560.1 SDR family oxidoreductase [Anaerolineae bacterium]
MQLSDRVAIVTGAARGIGAATAALLAQHGAHVAVSDIDADIADGVVSQIMAQGHSAANFPCDVSRPDQVETLVAQVIARWGKLDILVNNAGICPRIPVEEMTEEWFDRITGVNMKSVFFLTRAAAEAMKLNRFGRVVNVSSTGGRVGGVHNATVYSATKAGVLSMTKSLARHYAPFNILINAVAPGAVDTRMFESIPADGVADYVATVPLKRLAQPIEIAHSILPLCLPDMTWVTGATLDANGGVVMM